MRGGSGIFKQEVVQQRTIQGARQVQCQRFFPSRAHSQYFEVRAEDSRSQDESDNMDVDIWSQSWQQASRQYAEDEEANTIQAGEIDEVNPWLRRTGWITYLAGCQPKELLQSVQEPARGDAEKSQDEPIAAAIWDAIRDVATASQDAVRSSGVMLRFEAVRTEEGQVRYEPLQTYRDHKAVQKQCRPWQQMVMFFVRTQEPHQWKSPPYHFNRRQQEAFDRMIEYGRQSIITSDSEDSTSNDSRSSSEDDDDSNESTRLEATKLQEACLRFCIELLNQTMYSHETDMALVCALAVIGVSPKGVGFHSTKSFPSTLSAIIKIAHFMVVHQAHIIAKKDPVTLLEAHSSPCDLEDGGYESESAPRRRKPRSSFQWVKRMMSDFMVRGTASPMQWMLDLRAYGMKVNFNTTSEGHVGWKNGDELQYKDIHFNMAEFRGMVHQAEASAREALQAIVFVEKDEEIPAVPWQRLFDDPSNASPGWSFVNDPRTPWPVDGKEWMFQRIQQQPKQRRRFVSETATTGMNRSTVRDWLQEVDEFRGRLLALMHMTGGQPARGPEILSVRHSNTIQGGHRNLFIEDGMVVFVTHYHKGEHYKGDVKIIHRYLPREIGELVIWYTWLVVPFVQRIRRWIWPESPISQHIWGPDVDGRRWTTDRLKQYLQQATEAGLGHAIHVAAWRHIAIAISRQWLRTGQSFQDEVDPQDDDDVNDEQATHSPFIAGAVYARDMDELPGSIASRRQQFRAASIQWHRIEGYQSSVKDEVQRGIKREGDPFERQSKRARIERYEQLRQMDAEAEMSWMMRQEVTFRSVQKDAFQAIQRGDGKIVVVMPTGAGKSMLFMLPAFVGVGGLTIVVVPLLALRIDLVTRCKKANIRVAEWDGRKAVDGASIVLVTPEATKGAGFQTFLRRLKQTERLDRIVIDECHVILGEEGGFRPYLQKLGQLVSAHTQMLLLTATLPPTEESQLIQRMFWEPGEVTIIRASTVRRNIEYSVIEEAEGFEGQVQQLAAIVQPHVQAGEKVVVLCDDIERIKAIVGAGLFPCEAFHARLSSQVRQELLSAYRNGNIPVLVATGTFGTGIDISDIRLFVHVTMPDNTKEYAQSSGRAGRDGQPSRAVLIRGRRPPRNEQVRAYIDTQQCRRMVLDQFLDGDQGRNRCQKDERPCDLCQQRRARRSAAFVPTAVFEGDQIHSTRDAGATSSIARAVEQIDRDRAQPDHRRREGIRDRQGWQQAMQRRLQEWKNRCVVCYSQYTNDAHPISRCLGELGKMANEERQSVQRRIRYPRGHVCFRCGVPRAICSRWSVDGQVREAETGTVCQFYGVLIGVVYAAKHAYPDVWKEWEREVQRDPRWKGEMGTYLGLSIQGDEGRGCQIGRAFMWITEEINQLVRE